MVLAQQFPAARAQQLAPLAIDIREAPIPVERKKTVGDAFEHAHDFVARGLCLGAELRLLSAACFGARAISRCAPTRARSSRAVKGFTR